MADLEIATFFEHGRVQLLGTDPKSRQAQIRMCMPCCLFMAITPSLLGAGIIDGFKLHHPVAVWIPTLTSDRFHPTIVEQIPLVAEKSNVAIKQTAERTLQNFQDLMQFMPFPEDLIPSLPFGVYIEFDWRCQIDDIAKVLLNVEKTPHHGIAELRYAMAQILTCAVHDVDRWSIRFNP